jgi:hypothetical protein
MKKSIYILSTVIIFLLGTLNATSQTFNELVDQVQGTYVTDGLVDYGLLKTNSKLLEQTKSAFSKVDVNKLDDLEQRAFFVNAYNFWVIDKVVSHYPIESVMKVDGFFTQQYLPWEGKKISLNDFEQNIFKRFPDDARLHFMLICAATSCPDISNKAFTNDNYTTKIKKRTRMALRDDKMVKLDMHEKKVYVSKIFDWYNADFTKNKSVLDYINYYRNNDIPPSFEVVYREYDWSLNDKK